MVVKKLLLSLLSALLLFSPLAMADQYSVFLRIVDSTVWTAGDVPNYQFQCQVDTALVYENLTATSDEVAIQLTFDPAQLMECRGRIAEVSIPSDPIYNPSDWTAWTQGAPRTQPNDPTSFTVISIHMAQ